MAIRFFTYLIGSLFFLNSVNSQDLSDVLEDALSSVVTVAVLESDPTKQLLGFASRGAEEAYRRSLDLSDAVGSGSGFIVENDGVLYVITNSHVVEMAKRDENSIVVYTIDQSRYRVQIVGGDSFYDFAVLAFIDEPGDEINVLRFSTEQPRIGQRVFAIGNPLGEYPYSVSDGIISALNRIRGGVTGRYGFLQTTATLIYGNSGGPLVNEKGEVVGVNSQIAWANTGGNWLWQSHINFSLESEICIRLMNDILNHDGVVQRAFLGIELVETYHVSYNWRTGEYTEKLTSPQPIIARPVGNGPNEGLLSEYLGCELMAVNGNEIRNLTEALAEFEQLRPGQNVRIRATCNSQIVGFNLEAHSSAEYNSLIAHHFLRKGLFNGSIAYDTDLNTLVLNPNTNMKSNVNGQSAHQGNTRYKVVGLGSVSGNSVWQLQSFDDLAAAVRLFSTEGQFDLVIKEINRYRDTRPEYFTVQLSGDDSILLKTLFY